jgi:hypothetical protein
LDSGVGHKLKTTGGIAGSPRVERRSLRTSYVVTHFIEVLRGFNVLGVKLQGVRKRGTRTLRIAAEMVFGGGLDERRDRVVAGDFACEAVIGIRGIERICLVVIADGVFIPLIHEELARGEIELCRVAAIAVARLPCLIGSELG